MALTPAQLANLRPRFETKVRKVRGGCHWWTGAINANGYGSIILAKKPWRKRVLTASRVAYELYVGKVPTGMGVLHRCDQPTCVNPRHLFTGDDAANRADCKSKGRANGAVGAKNCKAKLTDRTARSIANSIMPWYVLAAIHNVSKSAINRIRSKKLWRHLWL